MNKLSTILYFLLPLTLASGEPQEESQPLTQSEKTSDNEKKIVKAIRTKEPIYIDFKAEMDLAVAASACPDLAAPEFGQPIQAMIYEP